MRADVAVVWDWESWWALELAWRPSVDLGYRERVGEFYTRLFDAHLTCDFVAPGQDLAGYRLVVVPSLYLTTPPAAAVLSAYVADGGTLVVSYFSGIVDEHDTIHPGAHPGALRDVLGVEVEEFLPLRAGETVGVGGLRGDVWAEDVRLHGAEAVLSYVDGPAAGGPAVTRHRAGEGTAWYVSTRLCGDDLAAVLRDVYRDAGLEPADLPRDLEVVRRHGAEAEYLFAINHTGADVELAASGTDLLTGESHSGRLTVAAGTVVVLRT